MSTYEKSFSSFKIHTCVYSNSVHRLPGLPVSCMFLPSCSIHALSELATYGTTGFYGNGEFKDQVLVYLQKLCLQESKNDASRVFGGVGGK